MHNTTRKSPAACTTGVLFVFVRMLRQFTAAPDKMKKIEIHGYLVFLDDAYRADPPGPDGKPTGRFRLAGRDRELRVVIEPVCR